MDAMTDIFPPIALFRTGGGALVAIHSTDLGFRADCGGCQWARTSQQAGRGPYAPTNGRDALDALRAESNAHALGCTEVPHELWPGANQAGW
jgi:hypothetical protein